MEAVMTPEDVLTIFERLNVEERTVPLDEAIAGFAGWLAGRWDQMEGDDMATLTSIGAALYKEGLTKRIVRAPE